ncbi:recombinase family protein [Polymorphospora lycopeni]|uniref:Recombinase family protein n=1 Tax=Polymorphospora lycopeni TaxID=3140240 RepID=A0ABV5D240_9ACTN
MAAPVETLYARKSVKDDGKSVESQVEVWGFDVHERGVTAGAVYADPETSASRFGKKRRPDWEALLDAINAGKVQRLAMWESSRGERRASQWLLFLELLRERGIPLRIISHERDYNLRITRDWKVLATDGIDAEGESGMISDRTRRGKSTAASKGLPVGSTPYGYRRIYGEGGKFVSQVIDEEQAAVIREIVDRILKGETIFSIRADLNDRGIPGPGNSNPPWRHIVQLVTNPAYAGQRVHQGKVVGDGVWPAIIEPEKHQRLVALLKSPARRTQRGVELTYWLSGAIACGGTTEKGGLGGPCPGMLRSSHNRPRPGAPIKPLYTCSACQRVTVMRLPTEALVETALLARLSQADALASLQPRSGTNAATVELQAELDLLRGRLDNLHEEAGKADGPSPAMLAAAERRLLPQIEAVEAKLRAATVPAVFLEFDPAAVVAKWPEMEPRRRRDVVMAMCELRCTPARRGGRFSAIARLGGSRWRGSLSTWADDPAVVAVAEALAAGLLPWPPSHPSNG